MISSSIETNTAASTDRDDAAREDLQVEREQPERDGGAQHLEHEHRAGDAVVARRDLHGLHVDHLVQALDV